MKSFLAAGNEFFLPELAGIVDYHKTFYIEPIILPFLRNQHANHPMEFILVHMDSPCSSQTQNILHPEVVCLTEI